MTTIKKVTVKQYKDLKEGDNLIFRSFTRKGFHDQRGNLVLVRTTQKDKKNEEGKILGKELVGETVVFEPLDKFYKWQENGQKLKVYKTTIGCGLFQIFWHIKQ